MSRNFATLEPSELELPFISDSRKLRKGIGAQATPPCSLLLFLN